MSTSGTLAVSDVDNPDNTFTPATIFGTIGTFAIDAAGAWTFTANSAFDSLNVGDNVNETFNVTSVDGTAGHGDGADQRQQRRGDGIERQCGAHRDRCGRVDLGNPDGGRRGQSPDNTFTPATIVGTIGTFAIDTAGAWTFTANSAFDSLNVGDNVNETFNVTSVDGTASTVTVQIDGTNDAAMVSSASVALTETDSALSTSGT